jgi:flagellar biosynthesis chaperone FliJ
MDTDPELSASYCDEMVATLEEVVSFNSWQSFQSFLSNINIL